MIGIGGDLVVVSLSGGLGNQLFQYATGLATATRKRSTLYLDITGFATEPLRQYELDNFPILAQIAPPQLTRRFRGSLHTRTYKRRINKLLPLKRWQWIAERPGRFEPDLGAKRGHLYLEGHWQSERYFEFMKNEVRQQFTQIRALDRQNQALADQITAVPAVALHVRRGDYVQNPTTNHVHGICSLAYYKQAIEYVAQFEPAMQLFIFSDDPDWVQEQLHFRFPSYVVAVNSAKNGHLDLRLMSLCRHHIIANSSFSWWGAWLATHPQQKVCAPAQWFRNYPFDIEHIIPDRWHLIQG